MRSLFITLFLLCLSNSFCSAISPVNDNTIKEAQNYGRVHRASSLENFFAPWAAYEENAQKLDEQTEHAYLYTPFLLVASNAREHALVDQTVSLADSHKLIQLYSGYLTFNVTLLGSTPHFSETNTCVLSTNNKTISYYQASEPEITKTTWYPNPPLYKANHYFYFLANQVNLEKPITLIVNTADKREHKFYFNLSNIK